MAEIFFETSLEGSKIILLNKYLTITNNNTDNNDNKPNLSEISPVKPATLALYVVRKASELLLLNVVECYHTYYGGRALGCSTPTGLRIRCDSILSRP